MVVVSMLLHAGIRRNDHREGAPHFIISGYKYYSDFCQQQATVELIFVAFFILRPKAQRLYYLYYNL